MGHPMDAWKVVLEMQLYQEVEAWDKRRQIEFEAVHRVLRESGPDGIGWNSFELAGCPSWEDVEQPFHKDFWKVLFPRFVSVTVEIHPGKTIVLRRVNPGGH